MLTLLHLLWKAELDYWILICFKAPILFKVIYKLNYLIVVETDMANGKCNVI